MMLKRIRDVLQVCKQYIVQWPLKLILVYVKKLLKDYCGINKFFKIMTVRLIAAERHFITG